MNSQNKWNPNSTIRNMTPMQQQTMQASQMRYQQQMMNQGITPVGIPGAIPSYPMGMTPLQYQGYLMATKKQSQQQDMGQSQGPNFKNPRNRNNTLNPRQSSRKYSGNGKNNINFEKSRNFSYSKNPPTSGRSRNQGSQGNLANSKNSQGHDNRRYSNRNFGKTQLTHNLRSDFIKNKPQVAPKEMMTKSYEKHIQAHGLNFEATNNFNSQTAQSDSRYRNEKSISVSNSNHQKPKYPKQNNFEQNSDNFDISQRQENSRFNSEYQNNQNQKTVNFERKQQNQNFMKQDGAIQRERWNVQNREDQGRNFHTRNDQTRNSNFIAQQDKNESSQISQATENQIFMNQFTNFGETSRREVGGRMERSRNQFQLETGRARDFSTEKRDTNVSRDQLENRRQEQQIVSQRIVKKRSRPSSYFEMNYMKHRNSQNPRREGTKNDFERDDLLRRQPPVSENDQKFRTDQDSKNRIFQRDFDVRRPDQSDYQKERNLIRQRQPETRRMVNERDLNPSQYRRKPEYSDPRDTLDRRNVYEEPESRLDSRNSDLKPYSNQNRDQGHHYSFPNSRRGNFPQKGQRFNTKYRKSSFGRKRSGNDAPNFNKPPFRNKFGNRTRRFPKNKKTHIGSPEKQNPKKPVDIGLQMEREASVLRIKRTEMLERIKNNTKEESESSRLIQNETELVSLFSKIKMYKEARAKFFRLDNPDTIRNLNCTVKRIHILEHEESILLKMVKTLIFSVSPINIFGSIYQRLRKGNIKVLIKKLKEKGEDKMNVYHIEMKRVRRKKDQSGVYLAETVVSAEVKAEFPQIAKEALAWLLIETLFGNDFSKVLNIYNMKSIQKYFEEGWREEMIGLFGENGDCVERVYNKDKQILGKRDKVPENKEGQHGKEEDQNSEIRNKIKKKKKKKKDKKKEKKDKKKQKKKKKTKKIKTGALIENKTQNKIPDQTPNSGLQTVNLFETEEKFQQKVEENQQVNPNEIQNDVLKCQKEETQQIIPHNQNIEPELEKREEIGEKNKEIPQVESPQEELDALNISENQNKETVTPNFEKLELPNQNTEKIKKSQNPENENEKIIEEETKKVFPSEENIPNKNNEEENERKVPIFDLTQNIQTKIDKSFKSVQNSSENQNLIILTDSLKKISLQEDLKAKIDPEIWEWLQTPKEPDFNKKIELVFDENWQKIDLLKVSSQNCPFDLSSKIKEQLKKGKKWATDLRCETISQQIQAIKAQKTLVTSDQKMEDKAQMKKTLPINFNKWSLSRIMQRGLRLLNIHLISTVLEQNDFETEFKFCRAEGGFYVKFGVQKRIPDILDEFKFLEKNRFKVLDQKSLEDGKNEDVQNVKDPLGHTNQEEQRESQTRNLAQMLSPLLAKRICLDKISNHEILKSKEMEAMLPYNIFYKVRILHWKFALRAIVLKLAMTFCETLVRECLELFKPMEMSLKLAVLSYLAAYSVEISQIDISPTWMESLVKLEKKEVEWNQLKNLYSKGEYLQILKKIFERDGESKNPINTQTDTKEEGLDLGIFGKAVSFEDSKLSGLEVLVGEEESDNSSSSPKIRIIFTASGAKIFKIVVSARERKIAKQSASLIFMTSVMPGLLGKLYK